MADELGAKLKAEGWNGWNDALDAVMGKLASYDETLRRLIASKGDTSDKAEMYRLTGELQGVRLGIEVARELRHI